MKRFTVWWGRRLGSCGFGGATTYTARSAEDAMRQHREVYPRDNINFVTYLE